MPLTLMMSVVVQLNEQINGNWIKYFIALFQTWMKRKCERGRLDFYDLKKPHDARAVGLVPQDIEWTYEKPSKVSNELAHMLT